MTATSARYRVTAFAISLAALAYMQRVAISQAAGDIQADLNLGKAQLGMVFGAFGLAYALFEIPSGLMGDRFGVRTTLTRIVVLWSAFTALTGAAWHFTSLCVEIGRRYAATTSGAMNMFGNFAGFVAPVGGGLILARSAGDWNVLLYLMVAASLAAAACWIFLDPEKHT